MASTVLFQICDQSWRMNKGRIVRVVLLITSILIMSSCSTIDNGNHRKSEPHLASDHHAHIAKVEKQTTRLENTVARYFDTYAERKDFSHFMSFYSGEATFEDVIYGNVFSNKKDISEFLDWNKGKFELVSGERIFTIKHQVINHNSAVTSGFFHSFRFDGHTMGPWLFVMVHEFDDEMKIVKQTDWINYTPREHFLGGKNLNELITEQQTKGN